MFLDLSIHNQPKLKFRLHIVLGSLVFLALILAIARIANPGTPPGRANSWGIAVTIKSLVFLTYQVLTGHVDRFKRWASPKANMILNIIDTIFWFALFIITIMGTSGGCSGSGCALGGILAALAFILCGLAGFLSFLTVRDWRYYKVHGTLPGDSKV